MTLGTILIIVLIVILLGALPTGLWLRLGRTLVSKGRPS